MGLVSQFLSAACLPWSIARPVVDPTHRTALEHAAKLLTSSYRLEQQQRAVEADRTDMPEPREALRQAHQARSDAQQEADRLRNAVERARVHQAEAAEKRDAAKQVLDVVEASHAATLIAELTTGAAGRVESVARDEREALAGAEHVLGIATRAVNQLAGEFAAVETRLAAAVRAVSETVCAVLLAVAQREAEEILRAADELDARRANLDGLAFEITQRQRGSAVTA
jgi:hypothetical protein